MTYLFYKNVDESQLKRESNVAAFGAKIKDPIFADGNRKNPTLSHKVCKYKK